jgi:hypothetical protein
MANKYAVQSFEVKGNQKKVSSLSRAFFKVYQTEFNSVSIFDVEDLEQEIWCRLFESNSFKGEEGQFESYIDGILKHILEKGSGRIDKTEIVPLSQLRKHERIKVETLLYGT